MGVQQKRIILQGPNVLYCDRERTDRKVRLKHRKKLTSHELEQVEITNCCELQM